MVRPVNYLFCTYRIEIDDENIEGPAEFALISENQGGEFAHGRERDGFQAQTLCTDPIIFRPAGFRAHSFEIGFKPGVRMRQEYDDVSKRKVRELVRDAHTKFGHVVTVPALGAMAIRDRASDDMIGSVQTIGVLKSFVRGVSEGNGQIDLIHASEEDLIHALDTWEVHEYSYTARPLNPTGGDLAKLRSAMYEQENVWQESGKIKAPPGESLRREEGTLGQTFQLYEGGYAQIGFKGETEDGHEASIPKQPFYQEKKKNLRVREVRPQYLRISFEREDADDDVTLDVARSLVRFYRR